MTFPAHDTLSDRTKIPKFSALTIRSPPLMADDGVLGPFGRLLPRPIPTRTGSSNSTWSGHSNPLDRPPRNDILMEESRQVPAEPNTFPVQLAPLRQHGYSSTTSSGDWGAYSNPLSSEMDVMPSQTGHHTGHAPGRELNGVSSHLSGLPPFGMNQNIPGNPGDHHMTNSDVSIHPLGRKVLREEIIPGKGLCYVYDDGSHIPKTIDSEPVNPQWGITKAGKPRKRLAQACTTCREKKIKCDPNFPKCLQCQKFGRECKFEPYARSSQRSVSPSTMTNSPTASIMDSTSPLGYRESTGSDALTGSLSRRLSSSKSSLALENLLSPSPSHDNTSAEGSEHKPNKRARHSFTSSSSTNDANSESVSRRRGLLRSPAMQLRGSPLKLDVDPYTLDPDLAQYYLDQYFNNINDNNLYIFPRRLFTTWVKHSRRKSLWDKMLLYALLALGTVFATNRDRELHGKWFAKVAHKAESAIRGKFTLQAIQTRLILAMYNFAKGNNAKAWDYSGSAVRCASGMRLNREPVESEVKHESSKVYDLPPIVLLECKRRTFWATMIFDQLVGFCTGQEPCQIPEFYLHLPCDEQTYEEGRIPKTPFFGQPMRDVLPGNDSHHANVGLMGQCICILALWTEIISFAAQMKYKTALEVDSTADAFYSTMLRKLDTWKRNLPPHLQYSQDTQDNIKLSHENIKAAQRRGVLGIFGGVHLFAYCALMRLNRHIYPEHITITRKMRNIGDAYVAAEQSLLLLEKMAFQSTEDGHKEAVSGVSAPFIGYAVICAIDILTAAGLIADLVGHNSRTMSLIGSSLTGLEQVQSHWKNTERQLAAVADRYQNILAIVHSPESLSKAGFYAQNPIEGSFPFQRDLMYKTPRKIVLRALGKGDSVRGDEELVGIQQPLQAQPAAGLGRDNSTWFDDAEDDEDEDDVDHADEH